MSSKIAVLTANLGNFDSVVENVPQTVGNTFYRFTDVNFPPCVGYTPRMQYRIPKMFGWEMIPDYGIYIWLDGSMSMQHPESVQWFLNQLGSADIAVFRHPWRKTIEEEVDHIEEHLQEGKPYITSRYKGGLHKEQLAFIKKDKSYIDNNLYTSTAFIYRNNGRAVSALTDWWLHASRYFTCDQVVLPYILASHKLYLNVIEENQYKIPYLSLTSHHK